jgi:lipopolysaccharide export system protein LptA
MRLSLPLLICLCLLAVPAGAQSTASPASSGLNTKAPVEITADDAIEWLRDQHFYRARGKAIVKQADTTIQADVIEAAYDPALGEQNIQTVTAIGHVHVVSTKAGPKGPETRTVTADKGVYNLTTGELVLTGSNLKITDPRMTVTAQQALTYDRTQNKASARGNAVITTPERTLKAQMVDIWLTADNELSRAVAKDHVIIQSAQEILQADHGDYDAIKQEAVMTGNVKLTRGENHLQGGKAVVNLKTGVSQLFGDSATTTASSGGRVRALFFPGSEKQGVGGDTAHQMIPMRPEDKMGKPDVPLPTITRNIGS